MNGTDTWGVATSTTSDGLTFNISDFAAYNNSALDWGPSYAYDVNYNWSWNNNTPLNKSTGLEIVWFYSSYNITWNGTDIEGNWT